ncbi:DNA polymerase delta small subunit Cdc1 [Sporothrix curviconia]|uniref:DNA polymerase delta small subunit Cdc1 n=1 Tax=Sporothrix curviconia TaxID=1260050 RepID=A0ABP0BLR3_9PEZI
MVSLDVAKSLLAAPLHDDAPAERDQSAYHPLHRFALESTRQYQQQFADMYFLRLARIKPAVDRIAADIFDGVVVGGVHARKVDRVLDVRQGELCWVSGTVYMDMPYKPNILDDVSKDKLLSKPEAVRKYVPEDDDDVLAEGRGSVAILLEDDSGRIRLVGRALRTVLLVTGCIVAVMGTENEDGELEVLDIVFPDLPSQPARWALTNEAEPPAKRAKVEDVDMDDADGDGASKKSKKIAIVSGLNFSGPHSAAAVETNLLLEFLLGESVATGDATHISRLIVAGNSIASSDSPEAANAQADTTKTAAATETQYKKYGYDSSSYNPQPSRLLDSFLGELLPSIPVTLLPGIHDIANASIPQQPIHSAMFPKSRVYISATAGAARTNKSPGGGGGWFDPVTNPWEGEVDGWRMLGTSGQMLDDIAKYVQGDDRLSMMEATCRWRCCAPTAPDTLWSYPYQEDDPFVLDSCPHVYFAGSQPEFGTRVITGPDGQSVRLVAVPAFSETREVILLDTETLDVSVVKIGRE